MLFIFAFVVSVAFIVGAKHAEHPEPVMWLSGYIAGLGVAYVLFCFVGKRS